MTDKEKSYNYDGGVNSTAIPGDTAHTPPDLPVTGAASSSHLEGKRLDSAERLFSLGSLTSGVCHELNNTLNAILMNAELGLLLLQKGVDQNKITSILRTVVEEVKRGGGLTRSVLEFARAEDHKPTAGGDLNETIAKARSMADSVLRRRNVQLELQLNDTLPKLPLNATAMAQAIANLIVNAAEAGATQVRVATDYDDANMLLATVTDNGPGILPACLDRVFEPFFTTHGAEGKLGLGLALAQNIVNDHQGDISVHSLVNTGTRFVIRLPVR